MRLHLALAAAFAFSLAAAHAAGDGAEPKDRQPSREAKAAFIKKCFRDRTKQACEAPPEARTRPAAVG